ncbi:hypothetical protein JCM8547_009029 [Rhodosporidiobolus lusitaniae]
MDHHLSVDDQLPPPVPSTQPTRRSDSISSSASFGRPSTSHGRPSLPREPTWREERSELQHELRIARAEIQNLQSKLGIKANSAPFNSSSPRKSSLATGDAGLPMRKPSLGDLHAASRRRSVTPDPHFRYHDEDGVGGRYGTSPRSSLGTSGGPSSPRGPPPLPEGAGHVAMNRALLSDDLSPSSSNNNTIETLAVPSSLTSSSDRPVSPTSLLPAAPLRANGLPTSPRPSSTSTSENPFFGGASSRERLSKSAASAQSGSGKVISGLQSDLLQARSALESTRGQLRLSQRAVEFLGRQTEDLKETKDRLSLEIDGLNRQLTRKERLQEEALGRARVAEAALGKLQEEHRKLEKSAKERVKGAEERAARAEEERKKGEREYASLREGLKSMADGWRSDLKWLKSDLAKSEKELEAKSSTLTKLLLARSTSSTSLTTTLSSLSTVHADFTKQHVASTQSALKQLRLLGEEQEGEVKRVGALEGELRGLRRRMVEYNEGDGGGKTGGGGRGEHPPEEVYGVAA